MNGLMHCSKLCLFDHVIGADLLRRLWFHHHRFDRNQTRSGMSLSKRSVRAQEPR